MPNLKTCKLTKHNWFTGETEVTTITPKNPSLAAEIHSHNNPDCMITVEWEDQLIKKMPFNMLKDEFNIGEEGYPDVKEFVRKWHRSKVVELEDVIDELEQEYPQDEPEVAQSFED